jgi:hypothetical protein
MQERIDLSQCGNTDGAIERHTSTVLCALCLEHPLYRAADGSIRRLHIISHDSLAQVRTTIFPPAALSSMQWCAATMSSS